VSVITSRAGRSAETRRQILKAANRLIKKRGLARVTTKDLAREADCAEGTLYKHFESKEDLFLAALTDSSPAFKAAVNPENANQGSLSENLTRVVLSAIAFFEQMMPQMLPLLADIELLERHRRRIHKKKTAPRVMYKAVAAYIRAEQALNRINPELEPIGAAAILLGPCCHWAFTRFLNGMPPLQMTDREWATLLVESVLLSWTALPTVRAKFAAGYK